MENTNDMVILKHKVSMWREVAGRESRDIDKYELIGDLI